MILPVVVDVIVPVFGVVALGYLVGLMMIQALSGACRCTHSISQSLCCCSRR